MFGHIVLPSGARIALKIAVYSRSYSGKLTAIAIEILQRVNFDKVTVHYCNIVNILCTVFT